MSEDLALFLADVLVCAVLVAVLYVLRRALTSEAWRNFLGITMTFIVLTGVGFLMIVGEHSLG
jgi:hypothetical protein